MPEEPVRGSGDRGAGNEQAGAWAAAEVRRLRAHLGLSQAGFAERLGTRQQTVSEWETGAREPRRLSRRMLHLVAESEGFYRVREAASGAPASSEAAGGAEAHGAEDEVGGGAAPETAP